MRSLRKLTIRKQMILLALLVVFLLAAVLTASHLYTMRVVARESEAYLNKTLMSLEAQIREPLAELPRFSLNTAYSVKLQDYLRLKSYPARYDAYTYIAETLDSLIRSSPFITSVEFASEEGDILLSKSEIGRVVLGAGPQVLLTPSGLPGENAPRYSGLLRYPDLPDAFAVYVEPIYSIDTGRGPIARMIVLLRMERFSELMSGLSTGDGQLFALSDGDGLILACNRREWVGRPLREAAPAPQAGRPRRDAPIAGTGWTATVYQPAASENRYQADFKRLALPSALLALMLVGGFCALLELSIARPLSALLRQMRGKGGGTAGTRVATDMENEIGVLAGGINLLLGQIEASTASAFEMREKLYENELSRTRIMLEALQNQINPHFLYNTLECLRSIGDAYGVSEVSQIALSMARIFRYCIKEGDIVPIAQDLEIIDEYLRIIQIRYLEKVHMTIDMRPDFIQRPILKMLVQPLVENAIYHGLAQRDAPGEVLLRGYDDGDYAVIEVLDDGAGMAREKLDPLRESLRSAQSAPGAGLGLRNVYQRMKLRYGEDCSLDIQSEPGQGTVIRLRFRPDRAIP